MYVHVYTVCSCSLDLFWILERWLMIMWNKRMPRESCVVVIRECSRKGIIKESVAVYDENENVFFKNGKRISKVKEWRYR